MSKKEISKDFTQGPIVKSLLLFAAPLFLSSLLQVVYNMVDMLVVGQFAGSAGLSAVSVGGDITNFLTIIAMAFSNAGSVIIAQLMGAGKKKDVGNFIGTLVIFLFIVSIVLSAVGLSFTDPILSAMNTPAESWSAASSYASICMWGLVFIYGYNIVSAVLRGAGDSKHPFVFIAISAGLNIVLDLVFVGAMGMGAGGAALATVISQSVSFIISVVFIIRNRDRLGFELDLSCFRLKWEYLSTLLALGIPMAIKQASVSISKLFVNSYVNSYGVTVSAVAGIGNKIGMIANIVSNSTNTAGSTMVGQNIGAEKYDRVPKIVGAVFSITGIMMAVMIAVLVGAPTVVFGLFTDDPEVIRIGLEYVPVGVIVLLSCLSRSGSNALINGAANYKVNFAVAIFDGLVMRIGCSILFGLVLNWGYIGFWMGDAVASFTPFVVAVFYYLSGAWKTRKYVVKD